MHTNKKKIKEKPGSGFIAMRELRLSTQDESPASWGADQEGCHDRRAVMAEQDDAEIQTWVWPMGQQSPFRSEPGHSTLITDPRRHPRTRRRTWGAEPGWPAGHREAVGEGGVWGRSAGRAQEGSPPGAVQSSNPHLCEILRPIKDYMKRLPDSQRSESCIR